jgi:hypothetical protein
MIKGQFYVEADEHCFLLAGTKRFVVIRFEVPSQYTFCAQVFSDFSEAKSYASECTELAPGVVFHVCESVIEMERPTQFMRAEGLTGEGLS